MNESPVFPMQPAPFKGESREVDPGSCFDWLAQGWAMFLAHPGVWLGASILLLVILMAISIVPLFGQVAAHLLVPLFGAGMVLARDLLSPRGLKPRPPFALVRSGAPMEPDAAPVTLDSRRVGVP